MPLCQAGTYFASSGGLCPRPASCSSILFQKLPPTNNFLTQPLYFYFDCRGEHSKLLYPLWPFSHRLSFGLTDLLPNQIGCHLDLRLLIPYLSWHLALLTLFLWQACWIFDRRHPSISEFAFILLSEWISNLSTSRLFNSSRFTHASLVSPWLLFPLLDPSWPALDSRRRTLTRFRQPSPGPLSLTPCAWARSAHLLRLVFRFSSSGWIAADSECAYSWTHGAALSFPLFSVLSASRCIHFFRRNSSGQFFLPPLVVSVSF